MKRIAVVEEEKCFPEKCGNYLCIRVCPVNREEKECIYPEPTTKKAAIAPELCIGCMICPKKCPFDAIHIVNLPAELDKDPIHQYGQNGFHLFNLPAPMFGKVVGLLGQNGIGKSTAMHILAETLKPNLGKADKEASFEELITFFRGTETQRFLEMQRDGKITTAFKPQAVELIPKQFSGTVQELLKKADHKGKWEEYAAALDLTKLLDHKLGTLSGGELQRLAIAATALHKANVYLFDEPTSFLDIRQRLKVAEFIRSLADNDTAVLVIEHDLIVLDAMADLIQVMYGEAGAYGIISQPRAVKVGINVYLSGYLREEKMKFRDHAITFEQKQAFVGVKRIPFVSWKDITKELKHFTLEAPDGNLAKNQVVGVVGENGIGKTTFVKVLAGVEKPTKGKVDAEVKVAYKPQYLESDSDELVMEFLQDALATYEVQLVRPLNLKPLLMKKLSQLSGGELQRVMIANTLSKKADLYLLDEPSAYLDVEQRLNAAKVIRNMMDLNNTAALVVDHDLLFLDYLSHELMVFDGVPTQHGIAQGPFAMQQGMHMFLEKMDITMRRDPESKMPRINKPESQMDRKQKKEGKRYYV